MPANSDKPYLLPRQFQIKKVEQDGTYIVMMEREGKWTSSHRVPGEIGERILREVMAKTAELLSVWFKDHGRA